MPVKAGQSVTVEFTTANPTTKAAANADATPTGVLFVNGTANAATVTVTNILTGVYKAAVTLPTLAAGDIVGIRINATCSSVAGAAIVWEDTADTVYVSEVQAAITAGVASTLTATAGRYVTDASANRVNSYTATFLSNGTNWITAPTTPAVAETGAGGVATAGSPFWLNVGLLFVAGANQYANSVTTRGFFSAGAARNCNIYAYNYSTRVQDQLSDATTRMATATTNQVYQYQLLSQHQKSTAAVATTSAGSNFSAAGTTVTANVNGHGFVSGDIVTISGITTLTNANGVFMVTRVNDNQFTYPILTQTATGGGTAAMTTDAVGSIRIGFKEGTTSSYNAGDRLNIDQCVINVASAGASAADIAAAVKQTMISLYYPDGVYVDTTGGGVTGTVPGTNGVRTNPCSTIDDAYTICSALNLRIIHLKPASEITLSQSAAKWHFVGDGIIHLGGQSITEAVFDDLYEIDGLSTGEEAEFNGCGIVDATIYHSYYNNCKLRGTLTTKASSENAYYFVNCADTAGAVEPKIVCDTGTLYFFRNYSGAIQLNNHTTNNETIINGAGRVLLGDTSTGGSVIIRGHFPPITGGTGLHTAAEFVAHGGTITQTQRFGTDQVMADTAGTTSQVSLFDYNGTCRVVGSPTTSQVQLGTDASSLDEFYDGAVVKITGGTGIGQSRRIGTSPGDYVGSTRIANLDRAWVTAPNETSTVIILGRIIT